MSKIIERILIKFGIGSLYLGRPRHRQEDNIQLDLLKVGYGGMDWMKLVQDRDSWRALICAVMNVWVP
jgi:hypothetical protein